MLPEAAEFPSIAGNVRTVCVLIILTMWTVQADRFIVEAYARLYIGESATKSSSAAIEGLKLSARI